MKTYRAILGILFASFCLLSIAATPGHAYIVYPDDPYWGPDARTAEDNDSNAATAGISAENPRSGNASLKLTLGGSDDWLEDLDDWAFYTRTAESDSGWGLLSDVTAISFDWYVQSIDTSNVAGDDPFNFQTPVLRLLIEDAGTYSELVWEQYYTDYTDPLTMGSWVAEDLMDQNFWRSIHGDEYPVENPLYTIASGEDLEDFFGYALMDLTIDQWVNATTLDTLFSSDAVVYGLSAGVGSYWKGEYLGYVDNIYLAFNETTVLDDNFELPVPEPSTLFLLGVGMATLVAGRRRRARG